MRIEFLVGLILLVSGKIFADGDSFSNKYNACNLEMNQIESNSFPKRGLSFSDRTILNLSDTIFPNLRELSPYGFFQDDSFLIKIIQPFELAYITWKYYKLRYDNHGRVKANIRKLYTVVAVDKDLEKAFKIELIWQWKKVAREKKAETINKEGFITRIRIKSKSILNYKETVNKFLILEALQFHKLDNNQLHNNIGPVNEKGIARKHDWSHVGNTEVLLKFLNTTTRISSYAPKALYGLYPKLYPDRKKFIIIYELFKD